MVTLIEEDVFTRIRVLFDFHLFLVSFFAALRAPRDWIPWEHVYPYKKEATHGFPFRALFRAGNPKARRTWESKAGSRE